MDFLEFQLYLLTVDKCVSNLRKDMVSSLLCAPGTFILKQDLSRQNSRLYKICLRH